MQNNKRFLASIALLVVAAIFLGIGFYTGEPQSYFQKAIQVCTQCIGIG
jgi:hypothetical protein